MKIARLLLLLAIAASAMAQETTTSAPARPVPPKAAGITATPTPGDTAALVKAAEAAKKARRKAGKSSGKVITNADLKKARSTLMQSTPPETATTPASATSDEGRLTVAKAEGQYRAIKAAEARVAKTERTVRELQAELARLEQAFYNENDPNYRDNVIRKRFEQTKRQLDGARQNLAAARDALTAVEPKS